MNCSNFADDEDINDNSGEGSATHTGDGNTYNKDPIVPGTPGN